jgi:hypothetical protein
MIREYRTPKSIISPTHPQASLFKILDSKTEGMSGRFPRGVLTGLDIETGQKGV